MSIIQMMMLDPYAGVETPANGNEFASSAALTLTVGADGSVTCGGYSDRWWATGATPPTCYATYGVRTNSAGQPASGTTMDASPTRTATSSNPAIVCDAGILGVDVAIYSAATGGRALCSFSFDMESSY